MKILLEYDRLGNIRNLDATQLAQKINAGLEGYSSTDVNKLIEEYCKKFFKNTWRNLSTMQMLIRENIEQNGADGVNDTEFWKFLKTAEATPINFKITPEQGNVLYNCLNLKDGEPNALNADAEWLYDPNAYTSTSKLKSCIFLNDKGNITRFGLYKDKERNKPLEVRDILNIDNDRELAKVINGAQQEFPTDIKRTVLVKSLISNFKDKFQNSLRDGELNQDELKKFVIETITDSDEVSPYARNYIKHISEDDNYLKSLLKFVSEQRVDTNSSKSELIEYITNFVQEYFNRGKWNLS